MRLLVVEDDPDLNRQLTTALSDAGYVVDRAFDGEEGHFLGDSEPYDAVVLDIGLPKMDGYEVARRLRAQCGSPCPCLIALTGYGQPEDRARALTAGFAAHLTKPTDPQQLQQVLSANLTPAATGS